MATGSFGSLPAGPTLTAAVADDPDDADASSGVLSVGDTITISFSVPTSMPPNGVTSSFVDVPELARLGLGMKYVFEFQQVKRNCGPRALGDVCRAALRRGLPAADVSGGSQNETACGDPG